MDNQKEYRLTTNENDGILEIIITGKITGQNVSNLQKEVAFLRTTRCNTLLVDVRNINNGSGYDDVLYYVRRPDKPEGKVAIVDLPANAHVKSFVENVSVGTSMTLKWFADADEARTWLKSKTTNDNSSYFNF